MKSSSKKRELDDIDKIKKATYNLRIAKIRFYRKSSLIIERRRVFKMQIAGTVQNQQASRIYPISRLF